MRSLTTDQQTAVDASNVLMVVFVRLGFTTPRYLNNSIHSIDWDGHTWVGLGALANIEKITETDSMEASGYTLTLALVDQSNISQSLSENVQGDTCQIWLGLYNPTSGALIDTPVMIDEGICDQVQLSDAKSSSVWLLSVESELADFSRPNVQRYTNADQQVLFPGDKFFEFVEQMTEKTVAFPSREFILG